MTTVSVPENCVLVVTHTGSHNVASYDTYDAGREVNQEMLDWHRLLEDGESVVEPRSVGNRWRVDRIRCDGGRAVIEKAVMTVAEYMAAT